MDEKMIDIYNNGIQCYLSKKDILLPHIIVYPMAGDIRHEENGYIGQLREYIKNGRVYVSIDGQLYNKAKLIYDTCNKDYLPSKRYTIINKNGNIFDNKINNLEVSHGFNKIVVKELTPIYSEHINVIADGAPVTIGTKLLLSRLESGMYHIMRNQDYVEE